MKPVVPAALLDRVAPEAAVVAASPVSASRPRNAKPGDDRPRVWLLIAAAGLCALAGAAAAVSYAAQYRLVYTARHLAVAAGLEAAIPDAAALVFACLGVALAMHGRHAIRARLLNAASAAASVFMNVIAAAPGWRDLAVWAMPPTAYALASDTLIGVVRTGVIARSQDAAGLAETSLLTVTGGLVLWLLRLSMAPRSTLAGFRDWVIEECPVAPGRRTAPVVPKAAPVVPRVIPGVTPTEGITARRSGTAHPVGSRSSRDGRPGGTKTARFLSLVTQRHGPLAAIPLGSVSRISSEVAPHADLNTGSARAALRRAVLAAHKGDSR
jgi:hypothetical protein